MKRVLMLTGDINLMNVTDPQVPFARVKDTLRQADVLFGNLECCFYEPANGHEATDNSPGVAVLTGRTAYEPMLQTRRAGVPPANRPGLPAAILTWADAKSLAEFTGDVRVLRARADIVVASHHWGLAEDVLDYQVEIAHAAIDAGADVVMGHGPHYACAVEMYQGHPIFYGLGSFSFHTGHGGRAHGDWVGMLARLTFDDSALVEVAFSMVRHNEHNETYVCDPRQDKEAVEQIMRRCDKLGTTLTISGSEMIVWKK